jgi:hypothetical protein
MNYDLAKQLKDAGFPIPNHGFNEGECDFRNCHYPANKEQICVPTLSELIEACGDKFVTLTRWKKAVLSVEWSAYGTDFRRDGRTLEEAVANLWLALNEKE